MTLEKAIEVLKSNYERALTMQHVNKPLAWACYYTWREVDNDEIHKHEENLRKNAKKNG